MIYNNMKTEIWVIRIILVITLGLSIQSFVVNRLQSKQIDYMKQHIVELYESNETQIEINRQVLDIFKAMIE